MIVYPLSGFDSYISEADALLLAPNYVNGALWVALTPALQSAYLLQAFRTIQSLNGFVGPVDPNPVGCLAETQFQVALQDVQYGFSAATAKTQEVKRQKAGPVEIEYFSSASGITATSAIPAYSEACLKSFGWVGDTSISTGVSTVRLTR